jgi:hypothetical protein
MSVIRHPPENNAWMPTLILVAKMYCTVRFILILPRRLLCPANPTLEVCISKKHDDNEL